MRPAANKKPLQIDQFFSISDSLGGAEQLMLELGKALPNKPAICFFKARTNTTWETAGFEVHYCNSNFISFITYCLNNACDTTFSSHLIMNALLGFFRLVGVFKTTKLICRESTSVFKRYNGMKLLKYKAAYRIGYHRIDLLITQTSDMKYNLLKNIPWLRSRDIKVITIPNLFQFPQFEIVEKKEDFPYIVAAGRLIKEKGFDILIDSFHRMQLSYPQLKLIILGEGSSRECLETQINTLGLGNKIYLPGFTTEIYSYFKGATLCVVSSRTEGFPNVLLQMMSQNNNVVSTLCAGDIDKIEGVYTAQTNNPQDLKEVMVACLENDNLENRLIYDEQLRARSTKSFLEKIDNNLNGN